MLVVGSISTLPVLGTLILVYLVVAILGITLVMVGNMDLFWILFPIGYLWRWWFAGSWLPIGLLFWHWYWIFGLVFRCWILVIGHWKMDIYWLFKTDL